MTENEIIIVDSVPEKEYLRILHRALDYALISIPFTIDRMSLKNLEKQIINIAKGRLAEGLLWFFFKHNSIKADFKSCTTPFYQTDKRDFLLNGLEWDQKNNFIYHEGNLLTDSNYTDLPALVPNRHTKDQWAKRTAYKFKNSRGVSFIFTFLKGADLISGQRGESFLSINLSDEQQMLLHKINKKYKGFTQEKKPFEEDAFRRGFFESKRLNEIISVNFLPLLIITAYADQRHWHLFQNTNHADFLNGTIKTKIKNSTCCIKELPSFLSLFPHLRDEIHYAKLI